MSTAVTNKEVVLRVTDASKRFSRTPEKARRPGAKEIFKAMIGRGKTTNPRTMRSDEFWAVRNVTFDLHRGEALGIVGLNGAGKSTLLKMILGRLEVDKGSIKTYGKAGGLIELGAGFHPELSGRRNIYVNAGLLGATERQVDERLEDIIEFADIGGFIDSPVNTYSSGMRVRLGFAVTVHFLPDIMICDEILAVGDFEFRQKCLQRVKEIRRTRSVVLVSHSPSSIALFCNRAMLIHHGEVILVDEPERVLKVYSVSTQHMSADELRRRAVKVLEKKPASVPKRDHKDSNSPKSVRDSSDSKDTAKKPLANSPANAARKPSSSPAESTEARTTSPKEPAHPPAKTPVTTSRSPASRPTRPAPSQSKTPKSQTAVPADNEVHKQLFGPEYWDKEAVTNVSLSWNLENAEKGYFLMSGEPLHIHLSFTLQQSVESFRIGLPIFDEAGVMIIGPDSRYSSDATSIKNPGSYALTMCLDPLPLNSGSFMPVISICDDPAILFRKHLTSFKVFNPNHEFGVAKTFPVWAAAKDANSDLLQILSL